MGPTLPLKFSLLLSLASPDEVLVLVQQRAPGIKASVDDCSFFYSIWPILIDIIRRIGAEWTAHWVAAWLRIPISIKSQPYGLLPPSFHVLIAWFNVFKKRLGKPGSFSMTLSPKAYYSIK